MFSTKLTEKISDPPDAKEHYQSFVRKKNTKSIRQSNIIIYQTNTFENLKILGIKPAITAHPKILHKLSKSIRQAEKVSQVGSNSSLYSDTKKWKFFKQKNVKTTKQKHIFKVFQVLIMLRLKFFWPWSTT